MTFSFHTDDIATLKADLLTLILFEENLAENADLSTLDRALDGLCGRLLEEEQFKGKKGQSLQLHTHGRIGPQRLLLLGAGKIDDFSAADLSSFAARTVKAGAGAQAKRIALALPPQTTDGVALSHVALGAALGRYKFDKYLSEKKPEPPTADFVIATRAAIDATAKSAIPRAEKIAVGVARARDLVNEPAGYLTPSKMAEVASEIAKRYGLAIEVLGPKECEKLGMGMFLGVAQGSQEEPRFIHLTYTPKGPSKRRIALVGKGVTFDSGGLSLKPSSGMEDMKIDMSGAAAVLSAIGVIADLGLSYEVHAFAACTENMISGSAYKLGDVLKSMNGKTVEINNTDAEGRLTLGDAITYALERTKPDELFDFATLTGACMVALGPHTAGVLSNNQPLADRWLAAAKRAGEDMWQLPLAAKLKDQLKSEIADMKNTGDRWGGAITAGLFLKEFVGETPWVHVDLAGPASADKEAGHVSKGGTGFAVATIVEYLE